MSPIAVIAMTVIGISLIIKLVTKCFELITWLPDNALRWIGHSAPSFGEAGQESQMHGNLGGAAQQGLGQALGAQTQVGNSGLDVNGRPMGSVSNAGSNAALEMGGAQKAGGQGEKSLDLTKADSDSFGGTNAADQAENKAVADASVGQMNGVLGKGGMSVEAGKSGAGASHSTDKGQAAQKGHGGDDWHDTGASVNHDAPQHHDSGDKS